ncbi:tetraspanin-4-like isoform X2 [Physella acuta]|uniref:tetraspanin-4-like isoform X2 n=1 Tax=Physella acuta TaxID=109671 RepID=UPI0027DB25F9|nr:tetraspanin-4-like isoform X2 [Physella acuta]
MIIEIQIRFCTYFSKFVGGFSVSLGLVFLVIGSLGVAGALLRLPCLLYVYTYVIVTFLLFVLVVSAILLFCINDVIDFGQDFGLMALGVGYTGVSNNSITNGMDKLQAQLQCCGITNYTNYRDFAYLWQGRRNRLIVPPSCCIAYQDARPSAHNITSCTMAPKNTNSYILRPCFPVIRSWFEKKRPMHIVLIFWILAISIGLAALSCFLSTCSTFTQPL